MSGELRVDPGQEGYFTAAMRFVLVAVSIAIVAVGCAHEPVYSPAIASPPSGQLGMPQQALLVGKVVSVNSAVRFVVASFPLGRMPVIGQRMNVYRGGVKMGEVQITGPQRDDNIVGDITAGNAVSGDEIREK